MLTDDQVRALLAVAMGYDNRRPGKLNIAAWTEAAARGRWNFDDAVEAIHAHYAESTEFLMPAHITKRIRAGAGQPPRHVALPPAQPASIEHRNRMIAFLRRNLGANQEQAEQWMDGEAS